MPIKPITRALFVCALVAGCGPGAAPSPDLATPDQSVALVDMRACPMCTGSFPVCDPSTFECVACLKDMDCGAGFVCAARKCTAACLAGGCASDGGSCDTDLGVCRGCRSDQECGAPNPRCDDATGRCVPCVLASDNCPLGSYCSKTGPAAYACVTGCKTDTDCDAIRGAPFVTCCTNKCVDINADAANCGSCAKACAGGTSCKSRVCQ